jgi:branched-chain amino acid transport system ATP-binding protein
MSASVSPPSAPTIPAVELDGIDAAYGRNLVVRDVSLTIPDRGIVALLGPNGAGKSTLLRVASGLMAPRKGQIRQFGQDTTRATPTERARQGLCLIPEGRGIFRTLTVADNLRLFAPPWDSEDRLDEVMEAFPILGERPKQLAGRLSGGQQQMLALARIFLAQPRVVLLDEVSIGLAPVIVDQIYETLQQLAKRGIALLIVEQYVNRALEMCDYAYLINRGQITYSGPPSGLDESAILQSYLGTDIQTNDTQTNDTT